jgi:hypothetical protein
MDSAGQLPPTPPSLEDYKAGYVNTLIQEVMPAIKAAPLANLEAAIIHLIQDAIEAATTIDEVREANTLIREQIQAAMQEVNALTQKLENLNKMDDDSYPLRSFLQWVDIENFRLIGLAFKQTMERKGITVIEVADALGKDVATMNQLLDGQAAFSKDDVKALYRCIKNHPGEPLANTLKR